MMKELPPHPALRLSTPGIEPGGSTPEQFGAHLRSEIEKWRKLVKVANIKLE